jgi:hypothetical protein
VYRHIESHLDGASELRLKIENGQLKSELIGEEKEK